MESLISRCLICIEIKVSVDEIANLTKDKSIKYSSNSEKHIATVRYLHNNRVKTKDGIVSATKSSNVDKTKLLSIASIYSHAIYAIVPYGYIEYVYVLFLDV